MPPGNWELTETYFEKWYRGRPERIGTEKGNSDSEHLHSTSERGKPEPMGASGGKADVGGGTEGEKDEREIELRKHLNETSAGSRAGEASTGWC